MDGLPLRGKGGCLKLALALLLAASASDYKAQIAKTETKLRQVQSELLSLQSREGSLIRELDLVTEQVSLLETTRSLLAKRQTALEEELSALGVNIDATRVREERLLRKQKQGLLLLYLLPRQNLLSSLARFGSVIEAYRTSIAVGRLLTYQLAAMDELKRTERNLVGLKSDAQTALLELEGTKVELDRKEVELAAARKKKKALLAKTREEALAKEKLAGELRAAKAKFEKLLAKLLAGSKGSVAKLKGVKLLRPVAGEVVGRFGVQTHVKYGTKTKNTGIDIRAKPGASVKAAWGGTVKHVGSLEGYGRIVILEHDGFMSIYCRFGQVKVKKGAKVVKGTVLGAAGGDPVHFELRVGKDAVDPQLYVE